MTTQTETNKEYDYKLNILMLGDYYTGKSSVVNRFINDTFPQQQQLDEITRGSEYKFKDILRDGLRLRIHICDLNRRGEKFRVITGSYYRHSHGFMLLYDITNQSSFENLQLWIGEIKMYCPLIKPSIIIIGNKSDLSNNDKSTVKQFKDPLLSIPIQLVSAKSSTNIDESFQLLIDQMKNNLDEIKKTINNPSSSSNNNTTINTFSKCNIL